jgi:hypothetical protein
MALPGLGELASGGQRGSGVCTRAGAAEKTDQSNLQLPEGKRCDESRGLKHNYAEHVC